MVVEFVEGERDFEVRFEYGEGVLVVGRLRRDVYFVVEYDFGV